jgi:ABC-type uncharacterized transport system involved in gliding motility auxiliary subunit
LRKLDDTLLCRVVFSRDLPAQYKINQQYIEDLLSEYKRASRGRIRVERLDPGASTQARQEAIDLGIPPVQIDKRGRDRRELQEAFMGLSLQYGDRREALPLVQDTQNLEYDITQRIKKLVSPVKTVVAFAKEAGALGLNDQALEPLRAPLRELYEVRDIPLSQPVPQEIGALWLVGPTAPLSPEAIANLKSFLDRGGALGLALDRRAIDVGRFTSSELDTGLAGLLAEWGLKFEDGLIFDPRCDRVQIRTVQGQFQMINVIDYPYFPWVADMDRSHPATKSVDGFTLPFA